MEEGAGVNRCAACGAFTPDGLAACPACGEPMLPALEDRLPAALPPIPDGGLAGAMPAWLRESPAADATLPPPSAAAHPNDPATFLSPGDLPEWLRALGRETAGPEPASGRAAPLPAPALVEPLFLPPAPLAGAGEAVSAAPAVAPPPVEETPVPATGIPRSVILLLVAVAVVVGALLVIAARGG